MHHQDAQTISGKQHIVQAVYDIYITIVSAKQQLHPGKAVPAHSSKCCMLDEAYNTKILNEAKGKKCCN